MHPQAVKKELLFDQASPRSISTEGIKYAGSKLKLIPYILALAGTVQPKTVFDGFSGTTRVAQALAREGYGVICNDRAIWSQIFAQCYLLADKSSAYYRQLLEHLDNQPGRDGWYTAHYGGAPCEGRQSEKRPWQRHNTRKLDAIREELDRLDLGSVDRAVCLTSLILALDQVDSTLGHYASYLREWSPRSYKAMKLRVPLIVRSTVPHKVVQGDVFDIAPECKADLAYFDPPYGSNNQKMSPSRVRYAAYYHIWTTVCLNDKPAVFGKANRRADTSDVVAGSVFEDFRKNEHGRFRAVEAIEKLLVITNADHILLSYSSGGRATSEELHHAIGRSGKLLKVTTIDYKKNVMAAMKWTDQWLRDAELPNREFLFLIAKR